MRIPIGILAYYVRRSSDQQAKILGLWYYQETYVPSTEEEKKVSVLAPIGTALIGFKKDQTVSWNVPSGKKDFKIMNVINENISQ